MIVFSKNVKICLMIWFCFKRYGYFLGVGWENNWFVKFNLIIIFYVYLLKICIYKLFIFIVLDKVELRKYILV